MEAETGGEFIGVNPGSWMLDATTPGVEERNGIDFADIYEQSELSKCDPALAFSQPSFTGATRRSLLNK